MLKNNYKSKFQYLLKVIFIVEPILPTNLSEYLIQSRYTLNGSDRREIRVRFNLPNRVCIACSMLNCFIRQYAACSWTEEFVYFIFTGYYYQL